MSVRRVSVWLSIWALVYALPVAASEPPADAVLAVIPFEDSPDPNRVIVDLAAEGSRPLPMFLDTGATYSVMTPRFARAQGVTVRPLKRDPYRRATSLGRDLQFHVDTKSSDSGSKTGWEYGLLGGNFLEQYVVEFDFEARTVRFLDADEFEVPKSVDAENEAVVPVSIVSGRPFVKISMNGKSVPVLIDTGAHNPLILSGKAASRLGVDVASLPPFGEYGTVKGPMAVSLYESDSFALAEFAFARTPVIVAPKGWYNQGGSTDSVLGYDTLRQFTVRIDYPRGRMWLRRNHSNVTFMGVEYATTRAAGLLLYPSGGGYGVIGFWPDSPAAQLGIRPGDHFVERMGLAPPTLEQTLAKVVSGEPLLVARRDGDNWVDVVLPEGARLPDVALDADGELREMDRERMAEEARERDAAALDRFEATKSEALYFRNEGGGWMRVPDKHRRRGPRDGDVWVTFEQMEAIRAAGGAASDAE